MSNQKPISQKRRRALRRRRLFLACCVLVLAILIGLIVWIVKIGKKAGSDPKKTNSDAVTSSDVASSPSESSAKQPEMVQRGEYLLDADYSRLLLVNGQHPLPDDFDYESNLTTIDSKYHNGQLDQIDAEVWPYMKAMIEAAWDDGVQLYVWSPYRSYAIQNMLFQKQVERCIQAGTPREQAEDQAATVVARPGTSEHHTGLCADFNMASDQFESTPMFAWLTEHAADYGFILRYPKDKTAVTGVIYESWHWRFVGINTAHEINRLGLTFEEYIERIQLPEQEIDAPSGEN